LLDTMFGRHIIVRHRWILSHGRSNGKRARLPRHAKPLT